MVQKNGFALTNNWSTLRDFLIICGVFVVSFVLAIYFDAFETVVEFVEQHESWELDELITGVLILSAILLVYSILKTKEANRANQELDKTHEDLKKTNEKLRVVGQFTRHDARNKLSVVTNNLYLARFNLSNKDETTKNIEDAEKVVYQISSIFEFASDYEKLGAEKFSKIDVGKSINEALSVLDLQGVELVNRCNGLSVVADSLLTRLFYNLVHNSLVHGKTVTKIKIYPQKTSEGIKIIYEDDGAGIVEDEKSLIFTEGYGKGTGYGLFLIHKMCETYGWQIKETGEHGKGARFEITVTGF